VVRDDEKSAIGVPRESVPMGSEPKSQFITGSTIESRPPPESEECTWPGGLETLSGVLPGCGQAWPPSDQGSIPELLISLESSRLLETPVVANIGDSDIASIIDTAKAAPTFMGRSFCVASTVIRVKFGFRNPLERSPHILTQTYGLSIYRGAPAISARPLRLYRSGRSPGRTDFSSRGLADDGREGNPPSWLLGAVRH